MHPLENRYLKPSEAAEYLSTSTRTLRRIRDAGQIKCSYLGRQVRYRISDLDKYMEAQRGRVIRTRD
jgi:excisionase family DNA binding protein